MLSEARKNSAVTEQVSSTPCSFHDGVKPDSSAATQPSGATCQQPRVSAQTQLKPCHNKTVINTSKDGGGMSSTDIYIFILFPPGQLLLA